MTVACHSSHLIPLCLCPALLVPCLCRPDCAATQPCQAKRAALNAGGERWALLCGMTHPTETVAVAPVVRLAGGIRGSEHKLVAALLLKAAPPGRPVVRHPKHTARPWTRVLVPAAGRAASSSGPPATALAATAATDRTTAVCGSARGATAERRAAQFNRHGGRPVHHL